MKFSESTSSDGMGGASFVRLKDGESIEGVFRGEVTEYYKHWVGKTTIPCPGRDQCDLCKSGERGSFTFRINFIIKENNKLVAKIFEQGRRAHKNLSALHKEYGLPTTKVKISRQGSTQQDTTYLIMPTKDQVTPQIETLLAAVKLLDLDPFKKGEKEIEEVRGSAPGDFSFGDMA